MNKAKNQNICQSPISMFCVEKPQEPMSQSKIKMKFHCDWLK